MKNHVIRIVAGFTIAATLLTACGSSDTATATTESTEASSEAATEADAESTDAAEETTEPAASKSSDYSSRKVGISIYQYSDDFMTLYRKELTDYLEALGFTKGNIEIADAANDQATQTNQIQSYIDEDVDVLIVNIVDPASAPAITDAAVEADIPLVYINREPDDAEEQRWQQNGWDVTYVGCNAASSGTMQGEIIAALDDKGDADGDGTVSYVVIEGDMNSVDAKDRTSYSVQALQSSGIGIQCLASESANWSRQDAEELMTEALEEYGEDIDVVFANNDAMALGALDAIQAAGRTVGKDIYLVGCDALGEAVEDVIAGTMTGTVFNDYVAQSHAAAEAAVAYITGAGNEHYIGCDYFKVTSMNAQDFLDSLS